jgi:hypothetical protein
MQKENEKPNKSHLKKLATTQDLLVRIFGNDWWIKIDNNQHPRG